MSAPVLSLIPSTRATVGTIKTTLADAAIALDGGSITLALRDNGPKVNGTLVAIAGKVGDVGDVFNAKNARNGSAYGNHFVLGTMTAEVVDGAVKLTGIRSLLDVTPELKAPLFTIDTPATATVPAAETAAPVAEVAAA